MTRFNGEIFATTRWTVVLAAGGRGTPQADLALEELCRTYWYPLYVYVRRHGHSREDAEDLIQAFFARLLEKNYLEGVSNDGGKFRAFLLVAVKRFLANEWDRANRQKRGGGVSPLSLGLAGRRHALPNQPRGQHQSRQTLRSRLGHDRARTRHHPPAR